MSEHYTIGRLASEANVPVSTVRYYERRGLVQPDRRSRGNYRIYGVEALDRLRFVRSAQIAGFTLSNIETLLSFRDGAAVPCGEVQNLIASRLKQVHREREHLEEVERLLRRWLGVCRATARTGRCGVLEALSVAKKRI